MADITKTVVTKMELDTTQQDAALKKTTKSQEDLGKETKKTTKETKDQSGALEGMTGKLDAATGGMLSGIKGLGGMVKGFRSLKVAIAATGIGALILALTSLFSWFNRTAEGQEKMKIITATLSGVFETLADIASSLGKIIFDAFENPKEAIASLWEFIKSQFINRLKAVADIATGVGRIIKAAFSLNFEEAKEELKSLGRSMIQVTTGLDTAQQDAVLGKVLGTFKEIKENVQSTVALQERENKLRRDNQKFSIREVELQNQIAAARLAAADEKDGEEAQLKAINEAIELTTVLFAEKGRLAAEELAIAQERDALFDSTLEDEEEVIRLRVAQLRLDGQRDQALKALVSRQASLNRASGEEATEILLETQEVQLEAVKEFEEAKTEIIKEQVDERVEHEEEADKALGKVLAGSVSSLFAFTKNAALNNVLIKTAEAVITTIAQLGWNPIGIAAAAQALGIGLAQASIVSGVQIASGRELFARGGMLGGNLHRNGGTIIEAERGEAILNRNSMANPFLRQLASDINQIGGGVAFAQQGMLVGQGVQADQLSNQFENSMRANRSVLVVEDFEGVQGRVIVTEDIATL